VSATRIIVIDGIYLDRSLVEAVRPATAVSDSTSSIIMRSGAVLLAQGNAKSIARMVWGSEPTSVFHEEP
jgi:hypothetical protein